VIPQNLTFVARTLTVVNCRWAGGLERL